MSNVPNPLQIIPLSYKTPIPAISISYPYVVGMQDRVVQSRINNAILFTVNNLMNTQISKLREQGYQNPHITVDGWFEIKTNESNVLSLTIGNYTIAYPAAHGLTILNSLTLDTTSGKSYGLGELFKPGSNYVKTLSSIVSLQIKQRDIQLINEFHFISPQQYYYIADKCLVLYFQLYDITPYAYGFPFFPISVYDIQNIIDQSGPLGKMLENY